MHTRLRTLSMVCLVGMGMLLVLMQPTGSARAETWKIPVSTIRNADGTLNTGTGLNGAIDLEGRDVVMDPVKGPIVMAQERATASQWKPIPHDGLDHTVFALAVVGNDLYVGGKFSTTADEVVTDLNLIAKYSGGVWSELPNQGLSGQFVKDIVVMGDDLYVGGLFTETADGAVDDLNNVAKFSNGQWSALPNKGIAGTVNDLEVVGGDLYVGGNFVYTGDLSVALNHIAKLSGGTWSQLPNKGMNDEVKAIKWFRNDLYVGGAFTNTKDSGVAGIAHFARLKGGTEWMAVQGGGLNADVLDMVVFNTKLVVGGNFTASSDGSIKDLNHILFWTGSAYEPLAEGGLGDGVEALMVYDGVLYVGGDFENTMARPTELLSHIAMYRNGVWFPLPNRGLDATVYVLAVRGGSLFAGGLFANTADDLVRDIILFAEMDLGANLKLRQATRKGNAANEFIATLTVTNRGPNAAAAVKLDNPLVPGYRIVAATSTLGTCRVKKGRVLCNIGGMENNQVAGVDITFRVVGAPSVVVNCAEVSSPTYDANPQNQKACARIPPE